MRYRPTLEVASDISTNLDQRIGESVQLIINYKVIEKTKSYTIMRVEGAYAIPPRRKY